MIRNMPTLKTYFSLDRFYVNVQAFP